MSTGTRRQHAQAEQDGYVRYANGQNAGQVRSCPTEEEFFRLCGKPFRKPEARG